MFVVVWLHWFIVFDKARTLWKKAVHLVEARRKNELERRERENMRGGRGKGDRDIYRETET